MGATMRCAAKLAWLLALVAALAPPPEAFGSDRFAGRPLAEALVDLQAAGLKLVYSSALVRPEMVVTTEPLSTDPRVSLRLDRETSARLDSRRAVLLEAGAVYADSRSSASRPRRSCTARSRA
jgi:hypothetical protein